MNFIPAFLLSVYFQISLDRSCIVLSRLPLPDFTSRLLLWFPSRKVSLVEHRVGEVRRLSIIVAEMTK